MAQQTIGLGTVDNDGTGDSAKVAFDKVNDNFTELYTGKSDTGHTHTAANITDFSEAVDDRVNALLVAGSNVTLTYNDGANTLTIASSGGGGSLPSAGTAGNLLTSDGTNWVSQALSTASLNNMAVTFNDGGVVQYGIKLVVTNTASAAGSRIMSLWYGSTEAFYVNPSGGEVYARNYLQVNTGAVTDGINGQIKLRATGRIGFSNASTVSSASGSWESGFVQGGARWLGLRGGSGMDAGCAINHIPLTTAPANPAAGTINEYWKLDGSSKWQRIAQKPDGTELVTYQEP